METKMIAGRRKFIQISLATISASLLMGRRSAWGAAQKDLKIDPVSNEHDSTHRLQSAIDSLSRGAVLRVSSGTYKIDASIGLKLKSDMTLALDQEAVLEALPASSSNYAVIKIYNANNVNVLGGFIKGERTLHKGVLGEWGMGVDIRDCSDILIQDVNISECWGDGIYVGSFPKSNSSGCQRIKINRVVCDRNRRQGLSLVACNNVTVSDSTFSNTSGTKPACGIDLEPNGRSVVSNVSIVRCRLTGNAGDGVQFYGRVLASTVESSSMIKNGRFGIRLAGAKNCHVLENDFQDNANYDIYVRRDTKDCNVNKNLIGRHGGSSLEAKSISAKTGIRVFVEKGARNVSVI